MLDGFLFSQDLVVLKSSLNSPDEKPCFLYLRCDPHGGEEIVSVGVLSSARNMEVYLGDEYCGTSRGENVCSDRDNRFVTCSRGGVTVLGFCGVCRWPDTEARRRGGEVKHIPAGVAVSQFLPLRAL